MQKNYPELHNHLYGSIPAELLFELGKKNPNPRWNIFTELYTKLTGKTINTETFFETYKNLEEFKKLYLFNYKAPFLEFQSKFNLIIALSKFDLEEIEEVAKNISITHFSEAVDYAEYRLMYSPMASKEEYFQKTKAACKGLWKAETFLQGKMKARLAISIHRDRGFEEQYNWLLELMKEDELVKYYLVGIDFCYIEENFPPKDKKEFFSLVNKNNSINPEFALSILYHVGESFNDKTPHSAVRWVLESALNGAHRLGHSIALGKDPKDYIGKSQKEKISERIDQIQFEIANYEELESIYAVENKEKLEKELNLYLNKSPDQEIEFFLDEKSCERLYKFQDFAMKKIAKTNSIIECCPTSNLLIGMLNDLETHPIKRFIKQNLKLTISSDDPGIFATNVKNEYFLLGKAGVLPEILEDIRLKSYSYTSEILTGKQ